MTAVLLPPSSTRLSQQLPVGVPTSYPLEEGLNHLSLSPTSVPLHKEKPVSHEPVVVVEDATACSKAEASRIFGGPALSSVSSLPSSLLFQTLKATQAD